MNIPFNNTYSTLPPQFYGQQNPTPVSKPEQICINHSLAKELGISPEWLESEEGLHVLSGNQIPEGASPLAQAYAGFQFGHWVPQLGDGRAILLGEVCNARGIQQDIQLKGSGITPFSRRGDGRSALGPVLREYLVSEAMYALGVPTTRALGAIRTGEQVLREEGPLEGGIFTRVASSHLRIGTFQYFYGRNDIDSLRTLVEYSLKRHYPKGIDSENPALFLLESVIQKQAQLIAKWMSLGFIHGVMNTDNCTISGETIDYGPCAFMDTFHPQCVFSAIDTQARYAWGNQPNIGQWNLNRFAETLLPLLAPSQDNALEIAKGALEQYHPTFSEYYETLFGKKLGIKGRVSSPFLEKTFKLLATHQIDFTLFFHTLTKFVEQDNFHDIERLFKKEQEALEKWGEWEEWKEQWQSEVQQHSRNANLKCMQETNPVLIPRNHQVERAIQEGYDGNFEHFHYLLKAWKNPYVNDPKYQDLQQAPKPHEVVHRTFCGT
jgi:uncharacterized protein YdiU (UPF0061 family)